MASWQESRQSRRQIEGLSLVVLHLFNKLIDCFFIEQFQEISHAYSVLSDKEKRKRYDQFGDAEDEDDMDMNDFMQVWIRLFLWIFSWSSFKNLRNSADVWSDVRCCNVWRWRRRGLERHIHGQGLSLVLILFLVYWWAILGRAGSFFDAADLDSEDEEEILEEFMMAHSEQVSRWTGLVP